MMTATTCPPTDRLRKLTLGQLSSEQSDELIDHLRDCETCRLELDTVAGTDDSLIDSLRMEDGQSSFESEPECEVAVAKALGALASVSHDSPSRDSSGALALVGDESKSTGVSALPQSIGEYEIIRPLGRGGMGSVFLARHTKLGREVAIKVLSSHRLADIRMRERFENEMRAIGRLTHPNIVTAHDAREIDGTAVLVTEFIDGFDLGKLISRTGQLPINDACEIIRRVAIALQYTSSQGFVHRDVKPSNIMLSSSGEVKLLDLGLARFQFGEVDQPEITASGQAMGTADYVSPEQVTDSRHVDVRSDIYSLGCTLFKLLTGRAPFADGQHETAFAKMSAHVNKQPPLLSDCLPEIPLELSRLVGSMMSKDPQDRPQTPEMVATRLQAFALGADLRELAEHAATMTQVVPVSSPSLIAPNAPATLPFLRRTVPISIAIAAGFFGTIVGLTFGIIITISFPDGTKIVMNAPDGSNVDLSAKADNALGQVKAGTTTQQSIQQRLQGTWEMVKSSMLHSEELEQKRPEMTFIQNRFFVVERGNYVDGRNGTFTIDDSGKQIAIDFDSPQHTNRSQGILRFLNADEMEICLSDADFRPIEFSGNADARMQLNTFKRSKLQLREETSVSVGQNPVHSLLQGMWRMTKQIDNNHVTDEGGLGVLYRFEGDRLTTIGSSFDPMSGSFAIDENRTPTAIDTTIGAVSSRGIIRFLDSDRMEYCIDGSGKNNRPSNFEVTGDSDNNVSTFVRVSSKPNSERTNSEEAKAAMPSSSTLSGRDQIDPNLKTGQIVPELGYPLQFAILVNRESAQRNPMVSENEIQIFRQKLQIEFLKLFVTESRAVVRWYPVADGVDVPIEARRDGVGYAIVSMEPSCFVMDTEIRRHVTSSMFSSTGVQLFFDGQLSDRMKQLSNGNLRNALAVIVEGKIVAAPTIYNEVTAQASIPVLRGAGNWPKRLSDLLFGGLVDEPASK